MLAVKKSHFACPDQINCKSSDAASYTPNGKIKCFSCGEVFPGDGEQPTTGDKDENGTETVVYNPPPHTLEFVPSRGLTRETREFYGIKTSVLADGQPFEDIFPYPGGGTKYRRLQEKKFRSSGTISEPGLFGQDKFPAASARAVTITEGEYDAASAFQMLGSTYPCVSVRGATSARKDCQGAFEYLNSFERIYLCFDNDEAGRKAAQDVASLFDFNKIYHVKLDSGKDANEYLTARKSKAFTQQWWNAKRYLPEGIVSSLTEFGRILAEDIDKPSISYPFEGVQEKTLGIRTGEFVLITAPEGIGKTEFIRRIEHHILRTTDASIAAVHLEETKARQLKGLAGIELQRPAHLSDGNVSQDEILQALGSLTRGRDDRLHIYSHFGSDDPDILVGIIRFLAAVCNCKYIFLDHITMVVTGLEGDDERRKLDYLSTKLATLCHDLDFTLFCISHVNDDGQTRGSRNISKVANIRIDLSRNLVAELEEDRNKTFVTVSKNRYAGKTGPAGVLAFDVDEFMLKNSNEVIHLPPE